MNLSNAQLTEMYVENKLLALVDEVEDLTRSDLQGRATVVAREIIQFVKDEPADRVATIHRVWSHPKRK